MARFYVWPRRDDSAVVGLGIHLSIDCLSVGGILIWSSFMTTSSGGLRRGGHHRGRCHRGYLAHALLPLRGTGAALGVCANLPGRDASAAGGLYLVAFVLAPFAMIARRVH